LLFFRNDARREKKESAKTKAGGYGSRKAKKKRAQMPSPQEKSRNETGLFRQMGLSTRNQDGRKKRVVQVQAANETEGAGWLEKE